MDIKRFNIRVYGIFVKDERYVLITDEFRLGKFMTKFPGGGLEFGEGTLDCLKREIREELDEEVIIKEHFYTTDFFQPSWLIQPPAQLISIYYLIDFEHPPSFPISEKPVAIENTEGSQSFRYLPLTCGEEHLTFPIDRKVWLMLKKRFLIS